MQAAVGGGPCGATARQRIPLCQRQCLPAVVILLVLGLSGTQLQLGTLPEPALKGFNMGPTTESIMEASLGEFGSQTMGRGWWRGWQLSADVRYVLGLLVHINQPSSLSSTSSCA